MEDVMRDSPLHVRYREISRTAATASALAPSSGKPQAWRLAGGPSHAGRRLPGLGHSETGAGLAPGRA